MTYLGALRRVRPSVVLPMSGRRGIALPQSRHLPQLSVTRLVTCVLALACHATAAAAPPVPLSLIDVDEKGVFNMGPGQGRISRASDETQQDHDVVQFNYTLPKTSAIGVWSNRFPAEVNPNTAQAIQIRVKVPEPDQARQVSVTVEVKGPRVIQKIPLQLRPGWNETRERIAWGAIGDLREVVLVVRPLWESPESVTPAPAAPGLPSPTPPFGGVPGSVGGCSSVSVTFISG